MRLELEHGQGLTGQCKDHGFYLRVIELGSHCRFNLRKFHSGYYVRKQTIGAEMEVGDQLGKYFNHPYKKEGQEYGNSDGSCKTWSNW